MGVTGSALVLRDHWDHLQTPPAGSQTGNPGARRSLDDVLASLTAGNAGYTAMGFGDLEDSAKLPVLYLEEKAAPNASSLHVAGERAISFDPVTGSPVRTREVYGGFFGLCASLHIYLGAGTRGILLNGILGVLFLGICVSGWVLWWPGLRGIRRALRVHWRARPARLNWDLHTAGGFWINPLLVLVVFTGVVMCLPAPTQAALAWLSGTTAGQIDQLLAAPTPASQPGERTTPEQAFQTARSHEDPDFGIGYLALASPDGTTPFDAYCYPRHKAQYTHITHIYINPRGGTLLAIHPAARLPRLFQWQSYMYVLHFGTFAGWSSESLWFLLGLTPLILLGSGVWMYLRRLRPRARHVARAERPVPETVAAEV